MIQSELISTSTLNERFHKFSEQLTGNNPATIVQAGKRPKSKLAYMLSYFRAFNDSVSNTSDVKPILGMMHFGVLCAVSNPDDMADIMGWPHGLRCLQGMTNRRGLCSTIFTGDGEQWAEALRNAGSGPSAAQEWGVSVYQQFGKHNLDELFGKMRPIRTAGKTGYFLE
jgi:hypothetical protein